MSAIDSILRRGVSLFARSLDAPAGLLRAAIGEPPRNDRGSPLDLHAHALLSLMRLARQGNIERHEPARARAIYRDHGGLLDLPVDPAVSVRELSLPSAQSSPRPGRSYRPKAKGPDQPLPTLLWIHGGGFVIGDLRTHAGLCSLLSARTGCMVLALDYRLAPEHPFPAAIDDVVATTTALLDPRGPLREWGGDPERVVLGGDSAGGNLSAAACVLLRDRGLPLPRAQALVYPSTSRGSSTASRTRFAKGYFLDATTLDWFVSHYLEDPALLDDPRVSPLLTPRLEGLPPAIVRTAGFDPLRDEGQAYAERLREAGVEVDYRCHERLIHGFATMGGVLPNARRAVLDLADDLRPLLHRPAQLGQRPPRAP